MQKSIAISNLPLITDAETFFNASKVLVIDVLNVDRMDNLTRLKLQIDEKIIVFNDRYYMPVFITCEPQNLFLKLKEGGPWHEIKPGIKMQLNWDRNLSSLLKMKKVYDLSLNPKTIDFIFERVWLYERFVYPYEKENLKRKCLNYNKENTAIVRAGSLS